MQLVAMATQRALVAKATYEQEKGIIRNGPQCGMALQHRAESVRCFFIAKNVRLTHVFVVASLAAIELQITLEKCLT